MEISKNEQGLPRSNDSLAINNYLSNSFDRTINSSLEHKDINFKGDYNKDDELSLEKGESSSFHPPDEYGFSSAGDFNQSYDSMIAESKRELQRQKFRRFRHKEYQCDECDRMFTLKHNLQNHFVQYHMGCKILHKACPSCKCTICGKIYSASSVLAEHMLHEHDEYIDHYECSKCRKDFLTGAELQKHMKEHNQEERTCPYKECKGLKFKLIKDLNEHVRSEHKLKKLTCSVCNMVFRQLSTRIKHEENHKKDSHAVSETNRVRGQERRAKCDEDLVKRDPTSLSPPPIKMRKVYSPQFEAIPIRKQTTKRLTRDEILAKIK